MSTHSQCRVNHSSGCSVTENLDRRIDSRVEWSTEPKAKLKSSKASYVTVIKARTMSLCTTNTADSVEWNRR